MKYQNFFKIFLINIIIFFVCIFLIEIVFGSWFKNNFSYKLSSERNIYRVYKFNFSNYSGKSIYERNDNGFRVDGKSKNTKEIDIIFAGGSTTAQKFLNFNDTIVNGLNKYFKKFNIVNAGIDGLSIKGHINSFKFWFNKIEDLNPKYYIFYIGINDQNLLSKNSRSIDDFEESSLKGNIREYLESNSFFYKKFRYLKAYMYLNYGFKRGANIVNKNGVVYGERGNKSFKKYNEYNNINFLTSNYHKEYSKLLNKLTNIVKKKNSIPIYITQIAGNGMNEELYLAAETVIDHCNKNQLRCINLAKKINLEYGDFYDALHLNPSGSKKVTDFLIAELKVIFHNN